MRGREGGVRNGYGEVSGWGWTSRPAHPPRAHIYHSPHTHRPLESGMRGLWPAAARGLRAAPVLLPVYVSRAGFSATCLVRGGPGPARAQPPPPPPPPSPPPPPLPPPPAGPAEPDATRYEHVSDPAGGYEPVQGHHTMLRPMVRATQGVVCIGVVLAFVVLGGQLYPEDHPASRDTNALLTIQRSLRTWTLEGLLGLPPPNGDSDQDDVPS